MNRFGDLGIESGDLLCRPGFGDFAILPEDEVEDRGGQEQPEREKGKNPRRKRRAFFYSFGVIDIVITADRFGSTVAVDQRDRKSTR